LEEKMKKLTVLLTGFLITLLVLPCHAQFKKPKKLEKPKTARTEVLTIGDIEPKLAEFPVEFEGVEYKQIDEKAFDDFFKSAAKLHGLSAFAVRMTDASTTQLKKYARSKYADEELKNSIDELTENTPPDQWTLEQAIAVEKLAAEKNKVSAEEKEYFVTTAVSLGVMVASLTKSVQTSEDLIKQGGELGEKAPKLSKTIAPAAASAVKSSMDNLKAFAENTPKLVKQLNALATGFGSL